MRLPSFGNIQNFEKETPEVKHLPPEEDLKLADAEIIACNEKISRLEELLATSNSNSEKELLQKKIVLRKIDLTEAQVRKQFLEEELAGEITN
jgi:hypothetical protein